MITWILLMLTVALLMGFFVKSRKWSSKSLPGPIGVPFLGSIPFLGTNPYKTLAKWSEKYGDMYMIDLGPKSVMVLNNADLIREVSKKNEFSGRPIVDFSTLWAGDGTKKLHGIVFNEGEDWQEQRRFALRHLRDLGFGKRSMEDLILNEVQEFLEVLKEKKGKPFEVEHVFELAVVNALWTLIAGRRFESNDEQLNALARDIDAITNVSSTGLAFFFPLLARTFPNFFGWTKLERAITNIRSMAREEVKKHQTDFDPDCPRDLIDIYLKEIQDTSYPKSSFFKRTGERSLVVTVMDLFAAGVETTSTALTWACLYLSAFPAVQKKLQQEVDRVVGTEKLPSLADRERMPYMEATIQEILRTSAMVPFLVFHKLTADTEFHGYHIPKDTLVMLNAYHVMHDPSHYEQAEEFRPERFIGPDGSFRSQDTFMAFGLGKRGCLGESLARIELFLFLTAIVQHFNLTLPEGKGHDLSYARPGIVLHPKPYQLILCERKA